MSQFDKAENEMRERFAKRLAQYPSADARTLLIIEQPEELKLLRPLCGVREQLIIDSLIAWSKTVKR